MLKNKNSSIFSTNKAVLGLLLLGFGLNSGKPAPAAEAAAQTQAALVIFPGAFLLPDQYRQLANDIEHASDGEVRVTVAKFTENFPNPIEGRAKVKAVAEGLSQLGLDHANQRVFVAGHSMGGIIAADLPEAQDLGGLILLGSYLPHTPLIGKNLRTYTKPVLTLGAELDGLTGINYLAREALSLQSLITMDATQAIRKPVIVISGASHMQFADGGPLAGDMRPEISTEAAHAQIATLIANFIRVHRPHPDMPGAAAQIASQVAATQTLLAPFFKVWEPSAELCRAAQMAVAPLAPQAWAKVSIEPKLYTSKSTFLEFLFDKSKVQGLPAEGGFKLHLPMYVERAPDLTDVSKDRNLSAEVVACKMRTLAAVVAETSLEAAGSPKTCAEINAGIIERTIALISPTGQARVAAIYGSSPKDWSLKSEAGPGGENVANLGPFHIVSYPQKTGQQWIAGAFNLKRQDQTHWLLTTAELQTSTDTTIKAFAGASYCKLIDPLRVVEWATLFGLKP